MISVRQHPYTRLVELVNNTGQEIRDVRIRFSTEGSGDGVVVITKALAPRKTVTWSLKDQRKRVRSITVAYRGKDGVEQEGGEVIRAPSRSYFRYLKLEIRKEGDLYGVGRAHGMPRPAYYPSGFGANLADGVEVDATVGFNISLDSEEFVPPAQFIEVVSFASNDCRIRFLSVLDSDKNPHEIPVNIVLKPGQHFDLEMQTTLGVRQLKVAYEEGGELKVAYADFTVMGHASFRYGSVLWDGLSDNISWMGQADFESFVDWGVERPRVVVQENPQVEYPDAFCGSPMRLLNFEPYQVYVVYEEKFWNEGPNCDPTRVRDERDGFVAAGQPMPLGCSWYKTPNMQCSWNKSWRLLSAIRIR